MATLRISADAALDLDEIWEYVAADNIEAADIFVARLHALMSTLAQAPGTGHRRRDLVGDRALLFFALEDYLVIYRRLVDGVDIVAIAHAKRHIPALIRNRRS